MFCHHCSDSWHARHLRCTKRRHYQHCHRRGRGVFESTHLRPTKILHTAGAATVGDRVGASTAGVEVLVFVLTPDFLFLFDSLAPPNHMNNRSESCTLNYLETNTILRQLIFAIHRLLLSWILTVTVALTKTTHEFGLPLHLMCCVVYWRWGAIIVLLK